MRYLLVAFRWRRVIQIRRRASIRDQRSNIVPKSQKKYNSEHHDTSFPRARSIWCLKFTKKSNYCEKWARRTFRRTGRASKRSHTSTKSSQPLPTCSQRITWRIQTFSKHSKSSSCSHCLKEQLKAWWAHPCHHPLHLQAVNFSFYQVPQQEDQ